VTNPYPSSSFVTNCVGPDRNIKLDKLGFPTDDAISIAVQSTFKSKLKNAVLIYPRHINELFAFHILHPNFVNEDVIRSMKWPAHVSNTDDEELLRTWKSATTGAVINCILDEIPVAISVSTYADIYMRIDSRLLFKVHYYPGSNEIRLMKGRFYLNELLTPEEIMRQFDEDRTLMKKYMCHYIIDKAEDLDKPIPELHPNLVRSWRLLGVHRLLKFADLQGDTLYVEERFNLISGEEVNNEVMEVANRAVVGLPAIFPNNHGLVAVDAANPPYTLGRAAQMIDNIYGIIDSMNSIS
jgi:hypothetical protein